MNSVNLPFFQRCPNEWAALEAIAKQIRSTVLGFTTPSEPICIKYLAQVIKVDCWPRGPAMVFAEPVSATIQRLHVCSLNEGRIKEIFRMECVGQVECLNECAQWLELSLNQHLIKRF